MTGEKLKGLVSLARVLLRELFTPSGDFTPSGVTGCVGGENCFLPRCTYDILYDDRCLEKAQGLLKSVQE